MELPSPKVIQAPVSGFWDAVPDAPAVFLVWAVGDSPYLGRTAYLRRRLRLLFREDDRPSRLLRLSGLAQRVEYWLTASRLESWLLHYELARLHYPDTYPRLLKLRPPAFVQLVLGNRFPRTAVTTRLSAGQNVFYGPFRSRAAAEAFESAFLDLFQLRRCSENLAPSAEHPGCMYGEMGMCLRPCQMVVGEEEYRSEAERVALFLRSNGRSLVELIARARDRFSEELQFEDAAREHRRLEKVEATLRLRDELAADIDRLYGVAVTASVDPACVTLWFVVRGGFAPPLRFSCASAGTEVISLDRRLRELVKSIPALEIPAPRRAEHLALLSRWYYSSWRDGEWLPFESLENVPYRKLVNAIHRVAALS